MHKPKYHVMVCGSMRMNGTQKGFCHSQAAGEIFQKFAEEVEMQDCAAEVMVTGTGCFGICQKGPIVVVYPEGVWYGSVSPDDVAEIVESHFVNGTPLASKRID